MNKTKKTMPRTRNGGREEGGAECDRLTEGGQKKLTN
jgi:hypothetical protein